MNTDPRTVDKLVDGKCFTTDELHTWIHQISPETIHQQAIKIDLAAAALLSKKTQLDSFDFVLDSLADQKVEIAMIRIWNYNKSRIHSFRGARLIVLQLDKKTIFRGEIKRAPGNCQEIE